MCYGDNHTFISSGTPPTVDLICQCGMRTLSSFASIPVVHLTTTTAPVKPCEHDTRDDGKGGQYCAKCGEVLQCHKN